MPVAMPAASRWMVNRFKPSSYRNSSLPIGMSFAGCPPVRCPVSWPSTTRSTRVRLSSMR